MDVFGIDLAPSGEIGKRPCNPADTIVSSSRETHQPVSGRELTPRLIGERHVLAQRGGSELRICAPLPCQGRLPRPNDARTNVC